MDEKKTLVHQQILGQSQTISKKPLGGNAKFEKLKKIDRLNKKLNFYSSLKANALKICENSTHDILFCKIKHRN